MNFVYISLLGFALCFLLSATFPILRKNILYIFAIGAIINGSVFTAYYFPVYSYSLGFGVDSVLHTLFLFCIVLTYFYYGKKESLILTLTALASLSFSAIVQFVASCCSNGFSTTFLLDFAAYIVVMLISFLLVYFIIWLLEKTIANAPKFLMVANGLLISGVVFTFLYYGFVVLINPTFADKFLPVVGGSLIVRVITIIFCIATFLYLQKKEKSK